jgi:uncharacterized protein (DUF1684 family)
LSEFLDLYDYRARVAAMYRERKRAILAGDDADQVCQRFRSARDALFATHPQSALDEEQRVHFEGLHYFPYNHVACVEAEVDSQVEPVVLMVAMNVHESMTMTRVAYLHFVLDGQQATLAMYWLNIYSGGLFLPFRDATAPAESYGGGRYLFDTIKGSDFFPAPGVLPTQRIVLDFNYAYNPSCAYNSRWVCPLSPAENRLGIAIPAGEQNFH